MRMTQTLTAGLRSGVYNKTIAAALAELQKQVPPEYRNRDELEAQIEFYCLEAIDEYHHDTCADFHTFLAQHLKVRTAFYCHQLWLRVSRSTTVEWFRDNYWLRN